MDPSADLEFDYLGVQTLYDRYLIIDKSKGLEHARRIETPQFFWMRVAMGLFIAEEEKEVKAKALYKLYKSRRFCSSTPTLFNSGTCHSQLSSCYLYYVDDSIEGIMQRKGIAENAYLSKWAGGLGGSWTAVRGTGSYISGTNGESQGIVPFLKLHNDLLIAVNQGGKRRGSGCAYLETWHNDLYDFLELRKNTGDDRRRCHDMNTANWIPDLFMKRMEERGEWSFFRSSDVSDLHDSYGKDFEEKYLAYEEKALKGEMWSKTVPAIEVWKQMLRMIFETGHPWITFKDPCNVRSPQDHVGVVHSSNLCTEITLNTSNDETAVCNLGSVVLDQHLDKDGNIDHKKLKETVRTAIRALDNVIDINYYPTEAAKRSNQAHRPIGLGVMGLQNALYIGTFHSLPRRRWNSTMKPWRPSPTTPLKLPAIWLASEGLTLATRDRNGIADCFLKIPWTSSRKNADSTSTFLEAESWTGNRYAKNRQARYSQFQRHGNRSHSNHFQHHRHIPLYRAGLQEPLRQEQPLRRIHHSQPAPGTRPQSSRALEHGYAQQLEVL